MNKKEQYDREQKANEKDMVHQANKVTDGICHMIGEQLDGKTIFFSQLVLNGISEFLRDLVNQTNKAFLGQVKSPKYRLESDKELI